jgi:ATP-binding cassette subfamily B protein
MFYEIAVDKTTMLITHRLGCAKIADKIIVLDKGRIIEQGSHDDLINNDGMYARMYNVQREMYH